MDKMAKNKPSSLSDREERERLRTDPDLKYFVDEINLLTEDEKQQDMRDLTELQKETEETISNAKEIIRSLRTVAKKLDGVWRNCKISHAVGISVGIVGGLLSIGGGIATLMTAGTASPLLIAGLSLGGAGLTTKLGTAAVNSFIK